MKFNYYTMTGALAALPIGCVAGLGMMAAQAAEEVGPNSVALSLGANDVSGNQAAFQRRLGQDGDFYGGLQGLHLETESGDVVWTLDGRAILGNQDLDFTLGAVKDGLGYVKGGYKEFRTFYDLSGGYIPGMDFFDIDDEAHVDRGEIWIEAGLQIEDLPEVVLGYSHGWRDGQKDSTTWGQNDGGRKIAPSVTLIDEQTDTFTLDIAETYGNTDLGLGMTYRRVDNTDTRVMGSGVSATDATAGNTVEDTAVYEQNFFNTHVSSVSRLSDQMVVSFGYALTSMDTDIGGDRPSTDNTSGLSESGSDHALYAISGGAQAQIHVVNANLWWNPCEDIVLVPSIRAEFWDQNMSGYHIAGVRNKQLADTEGSLADAMSGIWPGGGELGFLEEVFDSSGNEWEEFTESLEVRYDGIENILLYAEGEFTQSNGDYYRMSMLDFHDGNPIHTTSRTQDSDLDVQKYTVGANWYAAQGLSFSTQAYYRNYDQTIDFDVVDDNALIYDHQRETVDFNVRMTWRALSNLTFVTRYDYQQSEIENHGVNGDTIVASSVESADIQTQIVTQSATWVPAEDWVVQCMAGWVSSETDTPSNDVSAVVGDFDSDYIVTNLTVGYALNEKTSVSAGYSLYLSDNYYQPAGSVGYGTDLEEHVLSLRVDHALSPNTMLNAGYAYFQSNEGMSGGNNDFDAHMVSTGLQVKF